MSGEMENWLPVVGFEDGYEVSDLGGLRNIKSGRRLNGTLHPMGYTKVSLGRAKQCLAHTLVAEAFLGPRSGMEVNHKNGLKRDNRLENLEYVTHQQNITHSIEVLGHSNAGSRHGLAKFQERDILEIRARRAAGEKLLSIAASFNCSFQHISDIANKNRWAHI